MSKQLLSLCSLQRISTRDGYVGALARVWLPFFGYWFANGDQISATNTFANKAQDKSYTMTGQIKPNIFLKAPGDCGDGSGV